MLIPDPTVPGLLMLEGEGYAAAYLATLNTPADCPSDLVNLVQFLSGPMLEGFCQVLHAALRDAAEQVRGSHERHSTAPAQG